jgi:hypothetical protein
MQVEIDALGLPVSVRIHGINGAGHQGGNETACQGKDIPWLQEVPAQPVYTTWDVRYRDVVILDGNNEVAHTYNLTDHNLVDTAKYEALKNMLIELAGGDQTP